MMKKRTLSALVTTFVVAMFSQAAVSATRFCLATSVAGTRQGDARTYKFTKGGIQFTVPAGWDVKADGNDVVKVFPKTGSAQIAFVALPIATDLNPDEKASLLCLSFRYRSLVNGEYQDHVPAEILGSQLGLHSKRRNENNPRFTLACHVDGFGILHLHNHLYYEIGFL